MGQRGTGRGTGGGGGNGGKGLGGGGRGAWCMTCSSVCEAVTIKSLRRLSVGILALESLSNVYSEVTCSRHFT